MPDWRGDGGDYMAKKSGDDYFAMLYNMTDCSHRAAMLLQAALESFSVDELSGRMEAIHAVEHEGDERKHALMNKLVKEFITPIDREDIANIANVIDDVTDSVEDVLIKAYMFNVKVILPEALQFVKIVVACCNEMSILIREFSNFRKSKGIQASIIELNRLEGQGDALYTSSMRSLFQGSAAPAELIAWSELYSCFEKCCDNCEHVANIVENMIMKNT